MTFDRISLLVLYLLTLMAVGLLIVAGAGYYGLPQTERPHHPLHEAWKPSGVVGHGLGMVGSFLMLVLLLYSARKRLRFMQRWGNIRYWLNYHIWMGVTGPLLVIFHTTFKIGGIVSIFFWSMIAVALSGVLGRYIYIQIPRAINGEELSERELDQMDQELTARLRERYRVRGELLALLDALSGAASAARKSGLAELAQWVVGDLTLPMKLRTVRHALREFASRAEISQTMRLVKRTIRLRRR